MDGRSPRTRTPGATRVPLPASRDVSPGSPLPRPSIGLRRQSSGRESPAAPGSASTSGITVRDGMMGSPGSGGFGSTPVPALGHIAQSRPPLVSRLSSGSSDRRASDGARSSGGVTTLSGMTASPSPPVRPRLAGHRSSGSASGSGSGSGSGKMPARTVSSGSGGSLSFSQAPSPSARHSSSGSIPRASLSPPAPHPLRRAGASEQSVPRVPTSVPASASSGTSRLSVSSSSTSTSPPAAGQIGQSVPHEDEDDDDEDDLLLGDTMGPYGVSSFAYSYSSAKVKSTLPRPSLASRSYTTPAQILALANASAAKGTGAGTIKQPPSVRPTHIQLPASPAGGSLSRLPDSLDEVLKPADASAAPAGVHHLRQLDPADAAAGRETTVKVQLQQAAAASLEQSTIGSIASGVSGASGFSGFSGQSSLTTSPRVMAADAAAAAAGGRRGSVISGVLLPGPPAASRRGSEEVMGGGTSRAGPRSISGDSSAQSEASVLEPMAASIEDLVSPRTVALPLEPGSPAAPAPVDGTRPLLNPLANTRPPMPSPLQEEVEVCPPAVEGTVESRAADTLPTISETGAVAAADKTPGEASTTTSRSRSDSTPVPQVLAQSRQRRRSDQSNDSVGGRSTSRLGRRDSFRTGRPERSTLGLHAIDRQKAQSRSPSGPSGRRESGSTEGDQNDPFRKATSIKFNQPVGSLSISPASRDVAFASRKGLYILDLDNIHQQPRFIPQGGKWQIADCQWSPHPSTSNLILTTSSQKLLVWDLTATSPSTSLHRVIDAHFRAITDINWHAIHPDILASTGVDGGVRAFDLRIKESDAAVIRLSAWGMAGTQVKWNRQHEHILASSHGNEVRIWDTRKGSVPITVINAHASRIYGIDWNRQSRHQLVTCSLDKTIKSWSINELDRANSDRWVKNPFFPSVESPAEPDVIIRTATPVWRARNLPFGQGILSLPQRGDSSMHMWSLDHALSDNNRLVRKFEGHSEPVKEFVWRTRGGSDLGFEDRDFQLISWGKDRTLKIRPVDVDTLERVGYQRGGPIEGLVSRRGAAYISYASEPEFVDGAGRQPLSDGSALANALMTRDTVMTRGGGSKKSRPVNEDQMEWFMNVHQERDEDTNDSSRDTSRQNSRLASISRAVSRSRERSRDRSGRRSRSRDVSALAQQHRGSDPSSSIQDDADGMDLQDEIRLVSQTFPKAKFENLEVAKRRYTVSMNGPWADGARSAFIRVQFTFPKEYPRSAAEEHSPTIDLETSVSVSKSTRSAILDRLQDIRHDRPCLVACVDYLLGHQQERRGRLAQRRDETDSASEEEDNLPQQVPMMPKKACGASFGPNGELVCFFKTTSTLVGRARIASSSRSPAFASSLSNGRPNHASLNKAMSALAGMAQNGAGELDGRLRSSLLAADLSTQPGRRRAPGANLVELQAKALSSLVIQPLDHQSTAKHSAAARYIIGDTASGFIHNRQVAEHHGLALHARIWDTLATMLTTEVPHLAVESPTPRFRRRQQERVKETINDNKISRAVFLTMLTELDHLQDIQMLSLVSRAIADMDRAQIRDTVPNPEVTASRSEPVNDYFSSRPPSRDVTGSGLQTPRVASPSPGSPFSLSFGSSARQSGWASQMNLRSSSGYFNQRGRQASEASLYMIPNEDGQMMSGIPVPAAIRRANQRSASPRERAQDSSISRILLDSQGSLSPNLSGMNSGVQRHDSVGSLNAPQVSSGSGSRHRVSFGPGSFSPANTKKVGGQHQPPPKTARWPRVTADVAPWSVIVEMDTEKGATNALLEANDRPKYEMWRSVYANMLSRWQLYVQQAEILQMHFGYLSGLAAQPERGRAMSMSTRLRLPDQGVKKTISVATCCFSCGSDDHDRKTGRCRSCRSPYRPVPCAVCDLPVRGLCITCTLCRHQTHELCHIKRQDHLARRPDADPSCSAGCGCDCTAGGGFSGQLDTMDLSPPNTVRAAQMKLSPMPVMSPMPLTEDDDVTTPTVEDRGAAKEEDAVKAQRTGLLARAGIRNLTGEKFNFFG